MPHALRMRSRTPAASWVNGGSVLRSDDLGASCDGAPGSREAAASSRLLAAEDETNAQGRREVLLVGDLPGFPRTCICRKSPAGPSGPANPKVSSSRLPAFPVVFLASAGPLAGPCGPGEPKVSSSRLPAFLLSLSICNVVAGPSGPANPKNPISPPPRLPVVSHVRCGPNPARKLLRGRLRCGSPLRIPDSCVSVMCPQLAAISRRVSGHCRPRGAGARSWARCRSMRRRPSLMRS
jgi:hypothetical protein